MNSLTKILMASTFAAGMLAGCQTMSNVSAPMAQPITSNTLQAYNWQLVDAKRANGEQVSQLFYNSAKPLTLSFFKNDGTDRVTFMNTCNNMGAEYKVVNSNVEYGNMISTLMACPEPQASFDTAAMATVQGKYSINKNADNLPILTIRNNDQVAYFKAVSK